MADAGTKQNSVVSGKNKQTGLTEPFPIDSENAALRVMPVGGDYWSKVASVQLTGSAAAIFTATKAYKSVRIVLANTDTAAVYYATLYVLTGGASVADSQAIAKGYPVGPGRTAPDIYAALNNGDVIQGLADTTLKITATVYVLEAR